MSIRALKKIRLITGTQDDFKHHIGLCVCQKRAQNVLISHLWLTLGAYWKQDLKKKYLLPVKYLGDSKFPKTGRLMISKM